MPSRHWLYFGGFAVTAILTVGAGLVGLLDALSVLTGGTTYGEEFLVLAMLEEAAEWAVVALVLGLVAAVFLAATVVSVLRNTSVHRSDRLVSLVERLEREYPVLKQFDVSERVEPTTEDRQQELRDRYVAGEISEAEFEREMERLMDDARSSGDARSGSSRAVNRED